MAELLAIIAIIYHVMQCVVEVEIPSDALEHVVESTE
jgi:hypothetical protein